ncbi:MAG: pilus assembly protein, partial [Gammaproteobacteria bacterium]
LHYLKKKPGSFDRSFTVPEGHVLLMGVAPNAYDGRYWGTVPISWITGRATPLL